MEADRRKTDQKNKSVLDQRQAKKLPQSQSQNKHVQKTFQSLLNAK